MNEVRKMNGIERLENLGYTHEHAVEIFQEYEKSGKTADLLKYIEYKEMVMRSISEHVNEVLG